MVLPVSCLGDTFVEAGEIPACPRMTPVSGHRRVSQWLKTDPGPRRE